MFKNKLIFQKYKVKNLKEISNLCWTYIGVNIKDNEPVFIKIEKKKLIYNFLESEAYCLFSLKGFGIPKLISYGKIRKYSVLIEELLGASLFELWKLKYINGIENKKSNLKNICMVALQILDRLEYIHSKNYIHRDIKPQNFVIGRKDPNIIYVIDFGFSHQYRSSRTGKHIKCTNRRLTIGSLCYLSINANIGYEQSRRDDLESLGYMLLLLATGDLPWLKFENLKINKKLKYFKIYNLKKALSAEKLCKGLPEEFAKYINYSRKLDFEEAPNYDYLRSLFSSILEKNLEKNDLNFFWSIKTNNINKSEEKNSGSFPKMHKRKDSSKNRLFKKIKISLEVKSEDLKRATRNNNLHLEHVNNINLKPIYQKISYNEINRIYDNMKNITNDEQIKNKIIGFSNNYSDNNLNFNYTGNKNKKFLKYNKSSDNIKISNNEIYTNHINCLHQNNRIYYINKFNSNDKLACELESKEIYNSMNNNNYNKEDINNYYNNKNIKTKRVDKNIIIKRSNNYRTLLERQKEKNEYKLNNNSINYFQDNLKSINLKKNNHKSLNMKISLHKVTSNNKNFVGYINKKKIEKNNIYNNFINNSINKFHRSMKVSASSSDIKKDLLNHNNDIKSFQINKIKILKNCNSNLKIYSGKNSLNTLGKNLDSRIKFKEDNNLFNGYDTDISNKIIKLPEKKNVYSKLRIKIYPSKISSNDILSTNINSSYLNCFTNNKISFNNGKNMNLTQQDGNIKFMKLYENNFRKIKNNSSYGFMLKYN